MQFYRKDIPGRHLEILNEAIKRGVLEYDSEDTWSVVASGANAEDLGWLHVSDCPLPSTDDPEGEEKAIPQMLEHANIHECVSRLIIDDFEFGRYAERLLRVFRELDSVAAEDSDEEGDRTDLTLATLRLAAAEDLTQLLDGTTEVPSLVRTVDDLLKRREQEFIALATQEGQTQWLLRECAGVFVPQPRLASAGGQRVGGVVSEKIDEIHRELIAAPEVVLVWSSGAYSPHGFIEDSIEAMALRRWRFGSSELLALPLVAFEAVHKTAEEAPEYLQRVPSMPSSAELEAISTLFNPSDEQGAYRTLLAAYEAAKAL